MSLSARAPTHIIEMQTLLKGRRVGYWLSEKKMKKLNFQAFADLCRYVVRTMQLLVVTFSVHCTVVSREGI